MTWLYWRCYRVLPTCLRRFLLRRFKHTCMVGKPAKRLLEARVGKIQTGLHYGGDAQQKE